MKILIVHNYYRSCIPSGENAVVDAEIKMLQAHGHEVEVFSRSNDSIRKVPALGVVWSMISMIANPFALVSLRRKITAFDPDVIHMHNLFPLISPLALFAVRKRPVVMTLHNYRLFCAEATVCRDGRPCTLCLDRRTVWHALRYRCYRGHLLSTIPLAASIALYRALRVWSNRISRFIVLTEFQREMVIRAGLPGDRVVVKANHVDESAANALPWRDRKDQVVFVGRLSREKGFDVLLEAWENMGEGAPRLMVLGGGEELSAYQRGCKTSRVTFLGHCSKKIVLEVLGSSKLMIVPSLCFEGLPTTMLEAFSVGTPVLASDVGPLASIVCSDKAGGVFEVGSACALRDAFERIWGKPDLQAKGCYARSLYETCYTEGQNYRRLMEVYNEAMGENRGR